MRAKQVTGAVQGRTRPAILQVRPNQGYRNRQQRQPRRGRVSPALAALGLAALILLFGAPLGVGTLNYAGFCLKDGRILSDEEKVQIAVSYVMAGYPPVLAQTRATDRDGVWRNVVEYARPKDPIYYLDAGEFSRVNRNCCAVAARPGRAQAPLFWSRVLGRLSDFVRVSYRVRYLEPSGAEGGQDHEQWVAISNCGRAGP